MKKVVAALLGSFATALLAQAPPPGAIATEVLVVTGRCVDADSGEPLRRCEVKLTGHQSTGYPISWARADWSDPPEQTTGDDGRFRFELRLPASDEPLDRGRYHVEISHARHAGWFSHCAFVVAMERGGVDYGDVRLPKGVWPRVRCIDQAGALQPGVVMLLKALGKAPDASPMPSNGPSSWVSNSCYARTDIDGYLHLTSPLPAGDYQLEVRDRQTTQLPGVITLPSREPVTAVVANLDATMAIHGRLLDADGAPVGNRLLKTDDKRPWAVTNRDGRFTLLPGEHLGTGTVKVQLAHNNRFDGWQELADAEWGSTDNTLVLPTASRHTFLVRTTDGSAVERLNLHCMRAGQRERGGVRLSGTFANGRVDCQLPAGDYELLVSPLDARLASTDWQPITITDVRAEIAVTVDAKVERSVEMHFADGTPVRGALVEVIAGAEPGPFAWVLPATAIDERRQGRPKSLVVAADRTDEQGRVALQLPSTGELLLRVSGPTVRSAVRAVDLRQPRPPVRLEVERGAVLSGSIGPASALLALDLDRTEEPRISIYDYCSRTAPTLTIVYDEGRQRREGVRIDTNGNFRVEGMPPGQVEVQLAYWVKHGDSSRRLATDPPLLGTFTLDVAQPLQVALQLPSPGDHPDDDKR
ncbi:MAG: hypothetical protein H6835_00580 [Planctomycetes bacterium]|nr:hypothetical protein [Planctomycetota bacterium]